MAENKTKPTNIKVESFLETVSDLRRGESNILIEIIKRVSGYKPVMWGPSIIGFGKKHYKYDTGREGDMPALGFSPRKNAITIYFIEGFNDYGEELVKLGKYKTSVSCLYINKLADVDLNVLEDMFKKSITQSLSVVKKTQTVDEYVESVPEAARPMFDKLRQLLKEQLPQANEVLSYGVVGYKIDDKRARVFISGFKDHVGIYPVPKDDSLKLELKAYIRGKGTLWFPLDRPLPTELIKKVVQDLARVKL